MNYLYPLKMSYLARDYIWGGNRLRNEWNKVSESDRIAETWELSVRDDAMSRILNGELAGMSMRDYISTFGNDVVSEDFNGDRFPLLIKLIDAQDNLSVQVHPDDVYAHKHKNDIGKTEMWYIIDAKPGATIAYGLAEGISESDFSALINSDNVEKALNFQEVYAGECYFIPSGMVHAIGNGILIAEIQQNCDITYRIYDYNRRQKDGSLRALHVNDALAVVRNYSDEDIKKLSRENGSRNPHELVACRYFNVCKFSLKGEKKDFIASSKSFNSVLCIDGNGYIEMRENTYSINKGDSYYIPANMGLYSISGNIDFLITSL